MRYQSTRTGDANFTVGLSEALAAGLAPDGGLYVPVLIEQRSPAEFDDCRSLAETARRLLEPFFAGDPLAAELVDICTEAFDFPAPLTELHAEDDYLLELFHGPTAAFKDFGARFLAGCLSRLPRARDASDTTILVATSGDTGAAVAAAFHQRPGFRVVILYPDGRVSPRQAHGLECWGDNVRTLRVDGGFDDCQRLVKRALADADLRARCPLGSANSISLGRWLPQAAYYAHAALIHWRANDQPLNFIVPTGNLGNALAALLVHRIGLPVGEVVLACNANRVLPDFFAGGDYRPRPSVATAANAMDVGAPSNFERLRWLYPDEADLRAAMSAHCIEDDALRATIGRARERFGIVPCPHTACGLHVLDRFRREGDARAWAVAATAHPAKFEQVVEPLTGTRIPLPPALADALARPAQAQTISADYGALLRALES